MRTCVIFNPAARGDKARQFRKHLDEIGRECALKQTRAGGEARKLAADAVRAGFETIVAAGGDGTLNEVLNGIGDVPGGFERARLAVLPLGTVNVFAREIGMPLRFVPAWATIRRGNETWIDLPHVEFAEGTSPVRRYFAQLAGAGLDARAIELVDWTLKKRLGPLAYVVAGFRALWERQSVITVTNGQESASGELILVGNGRLYGGDFRLFPRADLRDGLLEACVFARAGMLTLLRCGPSLLLQKTIPASMAQTVRGATLRFTSEAGAPFEVDGEGAGRLPATFSVERERLRVVVP